MVREDIYYIVIPIIIALLGWFHSFAKETQKVFICKWRNIFKEDSCKWYSKYSIKIILYGSILRLLVYAFLTNVDILLVSCLDVKIDTKLLIKGDTVLCLILLAVLVFVCKFEPEKFKFKKKRKHEKCIIYYLHYMPLVFCLWLWGISSLFENKIISFIVVVSQILCGMIALIMLDDKKEYKYEWSSMHFKNGCKITVPTGCINQIGSWLIISDTSNSREVRCKQEELQHVTFFNDIHRVSYDACNLDREEHRQ